MCSVVTALLVNKRVALCLAPSSGLLDDVSFGWRTTLPSEVAIPAAAVSAPRRNDLRAASVRQSSGSAG